MPSLGGVGDDEGLAVQVADDLGQMASLFPGHFLDLEPVSQPQLHVAEFQFQLVSARWGRRAFFLGGALGKGEGFRLAPGFDVPGRIAVHPFFVQGIQLAVVLDDHALVHQQVVADVVDRPRQRLSHREFGFLDRHQATHETASTLFHGRDITLLFLG